MVSSKLMFLWIMGWLLVSCEGGDAGDNDTTDADSAADGDTDTDADPDTESTPSDCTLTLDGDTWDNLTMDSCAQTAVVDTAAGETTYGVSGGNENCMVVVSFVFVEGSTDPPVVGTYGPENLHDYDIFITRDVLDLWVLEEVDDPNFSLNITAVDGDRLHGTVTGTIQSTWDETQTATLTSEF
jgi:hypothetical protein